MRFMRTLARAVVAAAILALNTAMPRAEVAIAVGKCDRYGYTYGYGAMGAARAAALRNCAANGDSSCQVVVSLSGACGAFAVSGKCGARGWAFAPTRARAEDLALSYCERYGGQGCTVRMWVCDGG